MQIEVNEQFKFASVWLTNEEKNDADIMESLQPVIQKYREMKYRFVVFQSGMQDLVELTQGLLAHNKNIVITNADNKDVKHSRKTSIRKKLETLNRQVCDQPKRAEPNGKAEQIL